MTTVNLSLPEARAVAHVLRRSALAVCAGSNGRVFLDGDTLHLRDLHSFSFSGGELVLIDVVKHLAGLGRWPDLAGVDPDNRAVCLQAARLLIDGREAQWLRLLGDVEAS
jgi:hypothetical protein